ncbi:DUF4293 family protein [Flavobacteriaceae bacterium]|nr:DUF4293 family protein [Flavobacteriaceae bacterium]
MKRISFFLFIYSISINSQTLNDVLEFSIENPIGTARFESMGGAFGALGGDLSSININPAGSAVFNDNEYGFTIAVEKKTNKTLFFNNSQNEDDNNFSFNQGGAIWLLKNYGGGNINKISFGINVQTNNSYKNNFLIKGRNDNNSIDSFFLNNSSGLSPEILNTGNQDISGVYRNLGEFYGFSAQQAFLAYQAYLINYDDNLDQFYSIAKYNNGVDQEYSSESKGYNNKYNLNIGIQYKEDYYFGYYRIYITDYFFSEIISLIVLINIFLFKHSKVQIIILRILFLTMIFGLINLFDERSLETSLSDPGLIYFIISFVLIIMSIRSIKKDQVIISSSNRLR